MAETIFVYPGETLTATVTFSAVRETACILLDTNERAVLNLHIYHHPSGGSVTINNSTNIPKIFTLHYVYKTQPTGSEGWRVHATIINEKWDTTRRRYYR